MTKWLYFLTLTFSSLSKAEDYNNLVLDAIRAMPQGGGYGVNNEALRNSVQITGDKINVVPNTANNFCSGATYLVMMKVISELQSDGKLMLTDEAAKALAIKGRDGEGIWGRWNANGPGTAGLFHDLGLGFNFKDPTFSAVKPGDFMKIFWSESVGRDEHGHSVVFTRVEPAAATGDAIINVCFWSSNKPAGLGEKCVARTKIKMAIFSRLTHPEKLMDAQTIPSQNTYLAGLLSKPSSFAEAVSKTGTINMADKAQAAATH